MLWLFLRAMIRMIDDVSGVACVCVCFNAMLASKNTTTTTSGAFIRSRIFIDKSFGSQAVRQSERKYISVEQQKAIAQRVRIARLSV